MTLRRSLFAAVAVVCVLAVPALAGEPEVGPGPSKPGRAADTKQAHIQSQVTLTTGVPDGKQLVCNGTMDLWVDLPRGLYRFALTMTVKAEDVEVTRESHLMQDPGGYVAWEKASGKFGNTVTAFRKELKTAVGEEPKLEQVEHLSDAGAIGVPFVDAAFGYKRLKSETSLKPAKSPLGDSDNLRWQEIGEKTGQKADAKDKTLSRQLRQFGDDANAWLGCSPDTDWPMKYVIKDGRGNAMAFSVIKIDLKPDLKGVFDVPEDVKAKLEEKN